MKPAGKASYTRNYVRHVLPAGHPSSGLVCGKPSCDEPGLIWLEDEEAIAYSKGRRVFSLQTNTTKVRAQ